MLMSVAASHIVLASFSGWLVATRMGGLRQSTLLSLGAVYLVLGSFALFCLHIASWRCQGKKWPREKILRERADVRRGHQEKEVPRARDAKKTGGEEKMMSHEGKDVTGKERYVRRRRC